MLIIGVSVSYKTNVLLNLIKHQRPGIDKMHLYVKDPFESKYQSFINRREKVEMKKFKKSKSIDYSQTIDEAY